MSRRQPRDQSTAPWDPSKEMSAPHCKTTTENTPQPWCSPARGHEDWPAGLQGLCGLQEKVNWDYFQNCLEKRTPIPSLLALSFQIAFDLRVEEEAV